MMAIEIKDITKDFRKIRALENVNLTFEEGRIYGLLGRNGAGKSTLLKIISNRLFTSDGSVIIDGEPAKENDHALRKIYLMNESNLYPQKMKIKDIFKWTQEFYPGFDMEYAKKLSDAFGLKLNKTPRSLSTGYTSIYKIIIALSVNTPYVFLDEPVLGLDANHRDLFYRFLIEKYAENPFCCVISTHIIEEVSSVIEDVIIIKDGKVIRNQSRDSLLKTGYTVSGSAAAIDKYIEGKEVIGCDSIGGLKTAYILGSPDKASLPDNIEVTAMDLQKLFVQLTNS
ncbi:ATP-binding cassette domain-containing protein [Porcipelethomonas sp.]|uniref:ATP-binding cassette domain-containing protein n=1 Tax=Porcipelethomonas sp. TaxID=2981675 RepID=UPI003EF7CFCE